MYIGVHNSWDRQLRTADGMPSGLLLNLLGNLHMNLRTSSGDIITSDSSASVRLSISGRVPSSSVNTEENCALRISAFSLLLIVISPKLSLAYIPIQF